MWAALFPGQGSQSLGMGKFLFDEFAIARQTFEEASDTLGLDFKKLCFEGPETALGLTENTQPALLLVSTATFRVIASTLDIKISAAAGHSIGEYAAVVTAGSLSFPDALKAVRIRGQEMQKAVPVGQGGMLAVMGLNEEQATTLCLWAEQSSGQKPLAPANFNAPGQVVVSGAQTAIDWLKANGKAEAFAAAAKLAEVPRMKLISLAVSAPFHCQLMQPAEDEMRRVLRELPFRNSAWPIVQNFNANAVTDAAQLRENLVRQISGAVLWTRCMNELKALGCSRMIEFGAGRVLSGLAKKIDSSAQTPFNINTLEDLKKLELEARQSPNQSREAAN